MMKRVFFLILLLNLFLYSATFGVWDEQGDINKQTISSKISFKKFSLTVASLTKDKKKFENFTGTVCVKLEDRKNIFKFDWINLQFNKESKKSISFKVKEAIGDDNYLKVKIEYSTKTGLQCPIEGFANTDNKKEYFVSDSFCVRPYKFGFFFDDKTFISQKKYFLKRVVKALDYEGNSVKNYEKKLSLEYEKLNREGKKDSSLAGELKVSKISFENGESDLSFYFDDTAFLELSLKDSEFCRIDKKDTSKEEREISAKDKIFFRVDHFSLSFLKHPFVKNAFSNFTYLSNDLNHSAFFSDISVLIEAKGREGVRLLNYKDPKKIYFANYLDINSTISVSPDKNILKKDFPSSFIKKSLIFKEGRAFLKYKDAMFNYKKDYLHPINPFFVKGEDCNISVKVCDNVYKEAKGKIFSEFAGKALFYYAYFSVDDLKTEFKEIEHKAFLDIYCDKDCENYFKDFKERRINWFLNENDSYSVLNIKDFFPKISPSMKDTVSPYVGIKNLKKAEKGVFYFTVFNSSSKSLSSYVHINIPSWLWHSSYYDYNFSLSSDCSSHPCFLYLYFTGGEKNMKEIKTGEYKGVEIDEYNSTIKKRLLKVFR